MKVQYTKLKVWQGLCPPLGYEFTVVGKVSSDTYMDFRIDINRCNTTDPTCASDAYATAVETAMGSFQMVVAFVNTNINPGSSNYRQFYI
jgi:hypothetical protein